MMIELLVLGSLLNTLPGTIEARQTPLIGAQISVLEDDNWQTCEAYFRELKNLGYNTIILRVFHNHGDRFHNLVADSVRNQIHEGVYFKTNKAPLIADILNPACKSAKRAGLKIFAWMTTLKSNYRQSSKPQVLSFDENRGTIIAEKNLLDPQASENIIYFKQLFQDLATYPIDGILLQDDLMLRQNQGFSQVNNNFIPKPNNIYLLPVGSPYKIEGYKAPFYQWRQQQALQLQDLANQIFASCRAIKPGLLCAQNIHYELLYNADWGLNWFACSLESMQASTADYLMIMAYQEMIQKELELADEQLPQTMLKLFKNGRKNDRERIIFKFEIPDQNQPPQARAKAIRKLKETCRSARKAGWQDIVLTPCNSLACAKLLQDK
ncbi:MAG: family 10 glycosylhydrolase [Deltaproteobacteria bacterium]|nr:family 10 glycosylhydrolase [Deltaproteobacteria bacterium]